jgi:OOP family OmpA-OmpF porin
MWGPIIKGAVLVSLTFALAACANDLQTLKETKARGSAFSQKLAGEYLRFATYEADEMYDWPDSDHFAAKGLAAARGVEVKPERPEDWRLPGGQVAPINQSRKRLSALLDTGVKQGRPGTSARAQASFDCWVEQQEENWQTDHIAACRQSFLKALDQLEASPEVRSARFTMVLFPFDSVKINRLEFETLATIVARARSLGFADISVTGHTDRAGKADYNMDLSLRRAQVVRESLIRHSVPGALIRIAGKGESLPRVQTADGVREAINRRVEINFTKPVSARDPDPAQFAATW